MVPSKASSLASRFLGASVPSRPFKVCSRFPILSSKVSPTWAAHLCQSLMASPWVPKWAFKSAIEVAVSRVSTFTWPSIWPRASIVLPRIPSTLLSV